MIELGASILTEIVRSLINWSLCKIDHSAHAERAREVNGQMAAAAEKCDELAAFDHEGFATRPRGAPPRWSLGRTLRMTSRGRSNRSGSINHRERTVAVSRR